MVAGDLFGLPIALVLAAPVLVAGLTLGGILAWRRLVSTAASGTALHRAAKNAAIPMAASFLNKALDLAFAVYVVRVLGPTDVGRYVWAVLIVGYFDILINFGLGILVTRDVAREPDSEARLVGSAIVARLGIWIATLLAALGIAGPLREPLGITVEMGIVLAALTFGIGFSNLSGLISALFSARELMEYPALVTMFTTILKIAAGVLALALGFGIVGLAVVSIGVNIATGVLLIVLYLRVVGRPRPRLDAGFTARMASLAYPLMLNNLLATVFFRIDGLILRSIAGDAVLGWYSTAYKFIDGLHLIQSNLTLALFPILSRQAAGPGARLAIEAASGAAGLSPLVRTTELALKVLLSLAFPLAVGTAVLAEPLIGALAGEQYLPHSAIALQALVWLLPFSFANGLLQYVLIAANRQQFITLSFFASAAFNVLANLALIPLLSYVGAALVTVLSELVLLGLFWYAVQRYVGRVRYVAFAWRPLIAAAVMAPAVWVLREPAAVVAVPVGAAVYAGALLALGGVTAEERALIRRALGSPPAAVEPGAQRAG